MATLLQVGERDQTAQGAAVFVYYIHILHLLHIIWVNYNDLTAISLESWLVRENIPK
jgi:hypothetical protein